MNNPYGNPLPRISFAELIGGAELRRLAVVQSEINTTGARFGELLPAAFARSSVRLVYEEESAVRWFPRQYDQDRARLGQILADAFAPGYR